MRVDEVFHAMDTTMSVADCTIALGSVSHSISGSAYETLSGSLGGIASTVVLDGG